MIREYIGDRRPMVEFHIEPEDWPGKLYPESQLELTEADHMRIDEQGYDKWKEGTDL